MVLKFKRLGFFRKAKERKEDEKSEIVCLKYVQHQEFDACYLRTPEGYRLSQSPQPNDTQTDDGEIYDQPEAAKPTQQISFGHRRPDESDDDYEDIEPTSTFSQSTYAQSANREESGIRSQAESGQSGAREVEEVDAVRPIAKPRSILKNAQPAPKLEEGEEEKKSALIFMMENHEDEEEAATAMGGSVAAEAEVEQDKAKAGKSVMFDEINLSNKGEVIDKDSDDDYDSDDYEKDFSSNAASIFFDAEEGPDPAEGLSRISLSRDGDDESVNSQTSA